MPDQSALSRCITPPVPLVLHVENEDSVLDIRLELSLGINELCLVEEKTGLSMLTDIDKIFERPTLKETSIMLWAAVQKNNPEFAGNAGLTRLRSLLTFATYKDAMAAVKEAFIRQLPKDVADKIRAGGEASDPLAEASA